MKLIYIANARIPTEKAHGIQIMKMCEAFAASGYKVELILPWRLNHIKIDPFEYYGVRKIFKITKIPSLDLIKLGRIGFLIQSFSFAEFAAYYVFFKKADIIYSRDELPLFCLSFFKKRLFWESHIGKSNFVIKRILRKCKGIVTITQGLKNFYLKNYSIASDKILIAPDGVDLRKFDIDITRQEVRKKLNLPLDKNIIMYTGHLYKWKGAHVLAAVAEFLKNDNLIVFVGGAEKDLDKFRRENKKCKNILIVGRIKHNKIPLYLKSADVLVLPNSAKENISKFYTSPMKLFEYMASGRPIVASDLPSIREILNKKNAFLVKADNSKGLAEGIKEILQNNDLATKISQQARKDVRNYTWKKRAERILEFIEK